MRRSALLILCGVSLPLPTMAQDVPRIDRIEQLVRSADFAEARIEAQAALASGKLHRVDVARLYLQMGIIAAAAREDDPARASFRKALALEPVVNLPDSAGPHIAEAFKAAAAEVAISPHLTASARLTPVQNRPEFAVDAATTGDAEHLVQRVRINVNGIARVRQLELGRGQFLEGLPEATSACSTITVDALDEHDNELFPAIAHTDVCPPVPSKTAPVEAIAPAGVKETHSPNLPNSHPVPAYAWLGGVTVVGVVTTSVLGVIALGKARDYNDNANRTEMQQEAAAAAEHRATAAAIVTAAAGLATLVLYATRPAPPVRVGASVAPGAAMLLVSGGL